jgi:PAS domain S-box-containing protein
MKADQSLQAGYQLIRWLAGALAFASAVVIGAFVAYEYRETERVELAKASLLARVLEDYSSRTLDSTSSLLGSVAEQIRLRPEAMSDAGLQQLIASQRYLRSLSILDAQGRVLMSSNPENIGIAVDQTLFKRVASSTGPTLGDPVAARDLFELAQDRTINAPSVVTLLPMALRLAPDADASVLLAVVNPDALANWFTLTTQPEGYSASLVSYARENLVSTLDLPNADLAAAAGSHPIFVKMLPSIEHAALKGAGFSGDPSILAYRALRHWPAVVLVERSLEATLAAWRRTVWLSVLGLFAVWALVGVMAWFARRGLRTSQFMAGRLMQASDRLAERERDIRNLFEGVHEVLLRTDADGAIRVINSHWTTLTGISTRDVIGQPVWILVEPSHAARVQEQFASLGDKPSRLTVSLRTQGDDAPKVDLILTREQGHATSPGGVIGFAVDVTERERARRALRKQLAFSRSVLQVIPIPVWVQSTKGLTLEVNAAWESFHGIGAEDIRGRPLGSVLSEGVGQVLQRDDGRIISGEVGELTFTERIRRGDGQWREVSIIKRALTDVNGLPVGVVGSVFDITDFHEAQQAMQAARDAAIASENVKSGFIANVSHELRTPLQSILGFSELALRRQMSPERLKGTLEDIHGAGQRMLTLVNEILDISRLENAGETLELSRADVCEVVREVSREISAIATQKLVSLAVELPHEPIHAALHPFRFAQVLRNILANAVRFSSAGSQVEVQLSRSAGGIAIKVLDRGPGIPPDELEAIFEAFTQSSLTSDGAGGTGLGLTIARSIMRAHHGQIVASNRPDGGACFTVWLPDPDVESNLSFVDSVPGEAHVL